MNPGTAPRLMTAESLGSQSLGLGFATTVLRVPGFGLWAERSIEPIDNNDGDDRPCVPEPSAGSAGQ